MSAVAEHWLDWELVPRLTSQLQQHPELHLYGLIDGTGNGSQLEAFFQLAPTADYQPLFLDTEYASLLPASPYLIAPPTADCAFLKDWGFQAAHQVIWYLSALDIDAHTQHWRSLLQVITPEQTPVMFRFWNGAVLTPFFNACRPHERSALLAPCHLALLPTPPRRWQAVWTTPPSTAPIKRPDSPWWQLQPHQLAAFSDCFDGLLAEMALDDLWRTHPETMGQLHPAAIAFLVERALSIARSQGAAEHEIVLQIMQEFWKNSG